MESLGESVHFAKSKIIRTLTPAIVGNFIQLIVAIKWQVMQRNYFSLLYVRKQDAISKVAFLRMNEV